MHVGALRGPLIHDAIFRTLKARGVPVRYLFGVDDYDPVDEIPYGEAEHFEKYLGAPLCNVPPPPGSDATDMADHYISEFFSYHGMIGWLNQPLIQLPWFRYVPAHAQNTAGEFFLTILLVALAFGIPALIRRVRKLLHC